MSERSKADADRLKDYLRTVFGALSGAVTSAMICLGDRLGLYRVLAGAGPVTSQELADRTGLSERWLREWLQQQGAARVLNYLGDGRFELSQEGAAVLAQENHPAFGAGMFSSLPQQIAVVGQLEESFRTGVGLPYDAMGAEGAVGVERGFAPWFRNRLVPVALPMIPGVPQVLEAGIQVADVGCGGGVALIEMAKAFPQSEFHGYDISKHALERAEENRQREGVQNLTLHDASVDPLPDDARFGFVTTFDCLHDMTDPAGAMTAIRKAIRPDGTWLVVDVKAHATYEENTERNPMAGMMYGMSVLSCMSSALSEPDGLGLGTLGLHAGLLEQMTRAAGFDHFEPLEMDHPTNAFYVVRP